MSTIHVTKLVLETQSPMAIHSGGREEGFDNQLARDANGLPYIPASTIAGVWGHLVNQHYNLALRDKWFGSTEQSSSLVISHAVVHNQHNQPVSALTTTKSITDDPILHQLALERPHHRERVAINDRGVACDTGKFDQILLPKGVRFSLTLKWHLHDRHDQQQLNHQEWQMLLALWNDRQFAFGSSTRNGLGKIKVIACQQKHFDLTDGVKTARQFQTFFTQANISGNDLPPLETQQLTLLAKLPLQALDNWRCGTGSELIDSLTANDTATQPTIADKANGSIALMTYSEPCINWEGDTATLTAQRPVLCGSSIKGILAHRIAYHLRRHHHEWAETKAEQAHDEWQQIPEALTELLGCAADKAHQTDGKYQAGKLYVDDVELEDYKTIIRTHNKIDRFTGGVQQGALYSEQLLYQPKFTISLWIERSTQLPTEVICALRDTFTDLETGLLPMGAGSGRGNSLVIPQANAAWIDHSTTLSPLKPVEEQA
ncbi:RAMP superfamily CRISPR-associated protein [Vibrio metschnikovii]|uniref:RAMP superfamily CRISPR-associated protein n=1 Tax=Vibrio metschnikovii TaxID=28172 RepID=UPI002FCBAF27